MGEINDNNQRKAPKPSVAQALFARSGGFCSDCRSKITNDTKKGDVILLTAIAHIASVKPGVRYDPNLSAEEKRSYDNLIILCSTCHTKIDKDEDTYTIDVLKKMKRGHEEWVEGTLKESMPKITFKELEMVTNYLKSEPLDKEDYTIIPPGEKIKRNNFTNSVRNLITSGLLQSFLVKKYINECVQEEFYEKLKSGFVNKYLSFKKEGYKGDSLFHQMHNFASSGSYDFKHRAAALAVLTYFFEICEVFEK